MMPKYSLIIRCFNEERHIGRLLTGIMRQDLQDYEIILVDSGSTDATLEIARRFENDPAQGQHPAIPMQIVSIPSKLFSFGRALNIGCQAAQGDWLIFVSAHVYPVHADWLSQLVAPFADPQVALVYGKQRGNEKTRFSEHEIFAKWFPEQSDPDQTHPFCNNANAAVRRSLWQQFPYDEALTGLEDLDWAKRVKAAGWKIAYQAEAEIIHVHEETWKRLHHRYRREAIALKHILPEEQFSFWEFLRLFIQNSLSDLSQALGQKKFLDHFIRILAFRFMQFSGTYRGFADSGPLPSAVLKKFYYPVDPKDRFDHPAPQKASPSERRIIDYAAQSGDNKR